LWWGLFDSELYVEYQEHRYGPYAPIGKPIPINSYRSFKKTNTQKRADRIEHIAAQLSLPASAIGKVELPVVAENVIPFPVRSFVDPDPFEELTFKNAIEAKKAIAHYLVKPLAKLTKVPSNSEKRERLLLELIKKARSPVALFVDDAHGLHSTTLVSLKKLIELVRSNGERLSVILAGHPKLKNDLRRPTLEEIGGRTQAFALEGIRGNQSEYINWLLTQATKEKVQPTDILESETINFLSQRLSTPLQIEQYLTLAMNEAYQVGLKPITTEFMETVLAIGLDDLEPNLIRHGYNVRSIARLLNVKPADVRSFLYNQLPPEKIQDMRDQILKIGIPL
jgi:hypothetical protein